MSNFYRALWSIGILLIGLYTIYFWMITTRALKFVKNLKETYRYSIGTTIFVMAISSYLMVQNGQASQRMDVTLFMSLYGLFNCYIFLMSYFYSPSIGSV